MITRNNIVAAVLAIVVGMAVAPYAPAQSEHGDHGAATTVQPADPVAANPAVRDYKAAMNKMHTAMSSVAYSGNADADFVRGMIPHHQAAIDMARTAMKYGNDPQIRKLATDIIAAQQREIGQMEKWLAQHGKP